MKYKISLCISALCFLATFLITLAGHTTGEETLTSRITPKILRFHILAESNSAQNQALKLGLKGLVLDYVRSQIPDSSGEEELITWLEDNKASIETMSEGRLSDQGSDHPVTLKVTQDYLPARAYGGIVFPCSTYGAIRITIGNGKGHNWWCALYPSLCYTDSVRVVVSDSPKQTLACLLDKDDYRPLLTQKDKDGKESEVRVRFRFLNPL